MSVLVTTTFSQGAVFYAGETLSCTISFTNTIPVLVKSPSTSSSLTKQNRQKSSNSRKSYGHGRTPSTSSAVCETIPEHTTASLEPDPSLSSNGKSRSLVSLASSTLAYLTGYSTDYDSTPSSTPPNNNNNDIMDSNMDQNNKESLITRETLWEQQSTKDITDEYDIISNGEKDSNINDSNETIPIELESHEIMTPRTSIDTVASSYIHPTSQSRRSSVDSMASSHPYINTTQLNHHHHHQGPSSSVVSPIVVHSANSRRLSRLLKSPSTPSLLKKPEHLLWGFAQVVGQFIVDPTLINNNEFAPLKHRTMYRPQGSGFGGGGGLWNGKADPKIDTRTTPVFSTPPSILFVDLDLAPGETKKYSYKLKLPNDLPPSHRGKSIRFNYYLVVGTQRAGNINQPRSNGMQPQGQVVQLRFRILNHVSEDGSRPIYDLMNPVVIYKDEAQVELVGDQHNKKSKRSTSISSTTSGSSATVQSNHHKTTSSSTSPEILKERQLFMDYVNELLEKSHNGHEDIQEITRRESDAYEERHTPNDDDEDNDVMTEQEYRKSCAQVVSRITHASRKAMYDLCKNNQRVAKLQLTKIAHRLGESILGVLDFSEATLSTYKVSLYLESHEVVESSIALRTPQYITRVSKKCHSEFHSFCLNNRRLAFSLPIPTTASPEFQTTGVKLQYYLKLEFITSNQVKNNNDTEPLSPKSYLSINVDERHQYFQSQQNIPVSTFDCQIPIKIYGSPNGSDRATYGRPHTFSVI